MRPILSATLSFGLVNIPVQLASTVQEKGIKFRQLHRECSTLIKQDKRCPTCDKPVSTDDLVLGYEYAKDQFLTVEEDELAALSAERSSVIVLRKFVAADQISPLLVEKSYWLIPSKTLSKSYEMLETALRGTGLVGVGTSSLWGKEHPVALIADEVPGHNAGVLRLALLWRYDEVVSPKEIPPTFRGDFNQPELKLANTIIEGMKGELSGEDLRSESLERLQTLVAKKLAGEKYANGTRAARPPSVDLLADLKESVAALKKPRTKKTAARKAVKK